MLRLISLGRACRPTTGAGHLSILSFRALVGESLEGSSVLETVENYSRAAAATTTAVAVAVPAPLLVVSTKGGCR